MTGVSGPGGEAGECRSLSGVTGRNAGGVNSVVPVFHPSNGTATHARWAPENAVRFSFLTNEPASLPPRRMNLLRNEPLDVLQKV